MPFKHVVGQSGGGGGGDGTGVSAGGGGDGTGVSAGGGGDGELCCWHLKTPLSSVGKHSKNGKTEEQHSALLRHTSFNCLQFGRGISGSGDG